MIKKIIQKYGWGEIVLGGSIWIVIAGVMSFLSSLLLTSPCLLHLRIKVYTLISLSIFLGVAITALIIYFLRKLPDAGGPLE